MLLAQFFIGKADLPRLMSRHLCPSSLQRVFMNGAELKYFISSSGFGADTLLLNKLHLACRLRLTSAAALDVMPLGRRTDCGDARFAGVEFAVPASNPKACLQVSKSTSRHLALVKLSTRARKCMCCRMHPTVVLTSLPPSCVDPPAEGLILNLYSLSLMQTLCWYHQDGAGRCT